MDEVSRADFVAGFATKQSAVPSNFQTRTPLGLFHFYWLDYDKFDTINFLDKKYHVVGAMGTSESNGVLSDARRVRFYND